MVSRLWGLLSPAGLGDGRPLRTRGVWARLPRVQGIPGGDMRGPWGPLAAGWLYDGLHHYDVAVLVVRLRLPAGSHRHRSRALDQRSSTLALDKSNL